MSRDSRIDRRVVESRDGASPLGILQRDVVLAVCFVVAAPDGGVALCVDRNEELMVAESYASLDAAIERSEELRAALGAMGLPDEGND